MRRAAASLLALAVLLGVLFVPSAVTASKSDELVRRAVLHILGPLGGLQPEAGNEVSGTLRPARGAQVERTCLRFRRVGPDAAKVRGRWLCVALADADQASALWTAQSPDAPPLQFLAADEDAETVPNP